MSQPFYIHVDSNGRGYAYRLKHRTGAALSFAPVGFYTADKAVYDAREEAALLGCEVELSAGVEDALKA